MKRVLEGLAWLAAGAALFFGLVWMLTGPVMAWEPISAHAEKQGQTVRIHARPIAVETVRGFERVDLGRVETVDGKLTKPLAPGRPMIAPTGAVTLNGPPSDPWTLTITPGAPKYDGKTKALSLDSIASTASLVSLGGVLVQTRADGLRILTVAPAPPITSASIPYSVTGKGLTSEYRDGSYVWRSEKTGKTAAVFNQPKLTDLDGNPLDLPSGSHILAGTEYVKTFTGLDKLDLPKDFAFDVDVTYSAGESGTYTVGAYSTLIITLWGGGGSGESHIEYMGGGGGAGAIVNYTLSVTPGQEIAYSVGAGGAGGNVYPGNAGGNTTFGSLIGYGGGVGATGSGGTGGSATDGVTTATGGAGGAAGSAGSNGGAESAGGGTLYGGGGGGGNGNPGKDGGDSLSEGGTTLAGYAGSGGGSYGVGGDSLGTHQTVESGVDGGGGAGVWPNGYNAGAGGDGEIQITLGEAAATGGVMAVTMVD